MAKKEGPEFFYSILLKKDKKIGTPGGNGRVSNLPPEKSILPPGETFPVSPVAKLS